MFGGYLAFYTKKSKALNINMKTDYRTHSKNRLYNPTISHLETVSTISVAPLSFIFHLPSLQLNPFVFKLEDQLRLYTTSISQQ